MRASSRGKGPLAGWRGGLEETTDTFDVHRFLITDGPTNESEVADLRRAITEGGTFGDYRCVEAPESDGYNLFIQGPKSILFIKRDDRVRLLQELTAVGRDL